MLYVLLRQDNKWEFHVVNSKDINAFVLPGGKVTAARMPPAGMHMCCAGSGLTSHQVYHHVHMRSCATTIALRRLTSCPANFTVRLTAVPRNFLGLHELQQ